MRWRSAGCADAEEAGDPWGLAVLRWLLGEPVPAILALVSGATLPEPAPSAETCKNVPDPCKKVPDPVLALTFMARLALAAPKLVTADVTPWQECWALACRAATCLDTGGLPLLALECLQVPSHLARIPHPSLSVTLRVTLVISGRPDRRPCFSDRAFNSSSILRYRGT